MSGINKVILVGRLGKDPEVRALENGSKRASFTMATSEIYKDREGRKIEQTEWHNIVCWRKRAEFAEAYLTKGKLVYLEGKLRTRSWEENGIKKFITEIEAQNLQILSSKADENRPTEIQIVNSPQITGEIPGSEEPLMDDDDLPF